MASPRQIQIRNFRELNLPGPSFKPSIFIINNYILVYNTWKRGLQQGGCNCKPNFPGSHAHILHPISTLIFIIIYISEQQKRFRLNPSRFEKVVF